MSVSLYSGKVALKLLFLQFMTFVILSAGFYFKSTQTGAFLLFRWNCMLVTQYCILLLLRLQKVDEKMKLQFA